MRSGKWSDDGAGEGLEDLRRRPPPPAPPPAPAADRFELRAGEIARAVLDATGDPPHDCALLLRRAVVLLEGGYVRGRSRATREPVPVRVHLPGWRD